MFEACDLGSRRGIEQSDGSVVLLRDRRVSSVGQQHAGTDAAAAMRMTRACAGRQVHNADFPFGRGDNSAPILRHVARYYSLIRQGRGRRLRRKVERPELAGGRTVPDSQSTVTAA